MSAYNDAYVRIVRPYIYRIAVRAKNWWGIGSMLRSADRRLRFGAQLGNFFAQVYKENYWGDSESRSGAGSTLRYTEAIRARLPGLFADYRVRRFLDAPCGDFNWMSRVAMDGVHYTGGDIVADLIRKNNQHFANAAREFICLDLTKDRLPQADLWMCRDCLIHLSNSDIAHLLRNFLQSDISFVLLSTYPDAEVNTDSETGGFRPINLLRAPFHFPSPIMSIEDYIEGFHRRELALWSRVDLAASLARNPLILGTSRRAKSAQRTYGC